MINILLKVYYYIIEKKSIDDNFYWIYARYGKEKPYTETVLNINNDLEEPNPRSTNQIEPDKQIFGLYVVNQATFYLSSVRKKAFFEEYFTSRLKKDVVIKSFYKSVDEFLKQIKSIDKVKLIAKRNLFNSEGKIMSIFPEPRDLFGLGLPNDFSLEANFKNASVTKSFIQALKVMVGWKSNCEAEQLICIGRNDDGFESVFNADSFIQKVPVSISKDEFGMYDVNLVYEGLIQQVTKE